jgi:hypothetical protein
MKKFITLTFLLSLVVHVQAFKKQNEVFDDSKNQTVTKITMSVTFGDGMVLQGDIPVRIFGEASEGASITANT